MYCPITMCQKQYSRLNHLHRHILGCKNFDHAKIHGIFGRIYCIPCKKKFSKTGDLVQHKNASCSSIYKNFDWFKDQMSHPSSKRRRQGSSDNESGYSNRCSSLSPQVKPTLGSLMILVQVGPQVFLINLRLSYLKRWMEMSWHETSISNKQALIGGLM